jgi:hypothetical protein
MRLSVLTASNQFVGPGNTLSGMVAGGALDVEIGGVLDASGTRRVSFEPFLGAIADPVIDNTPVGPSSPQSAIAGVADLHAAGSLRRWYRLLYPPKLPPASGPGDLALGDSVTLVGAETRADLEAATTSFQSGTAAKAMGPKSLVYSVLRGRATVVPKIAVNVLGQPTWVSVGTTVRDIVERYAPTSLLSTNPLQWNPPGGSGAFTLVRLPVNGQTSFNPPAYTDATDKRVDTGTVVPDPRVYELPLQQGDVVTVRG